MDDAARLWVAATTDATHIEEVRSLTFGVVSDLRLIEADGQLLVLRRHLNEALMREFPNLIRDEVSALNAAKKILSDLVPSVVGSDPDGEMVGHPSLLMTYLPGSAHIHGAHPDAMIRPLVALHSSEVPSDLPSFHHWYDKRRVAVPEWTNDPDAWATLVDAIAEPEPAWMPAFIHRDFHPGNLLWSDGQLVGIVDWGFACQGPPAADVAHIRSNLALVDDVGAAERILNAYIALVPDYRHDPWWDAAELFTWDSEFAGVMAFNAFGSQLTVELLRSRADAYARAVAATIDS